MTYKELIIAVLKEANQPLSSKEIWQKATQMGLDKRLTSIGKTPTQTLWNRLLTDMKEKKPIFMRASKQPTTFWLKARENELSKALNPQDEPVKTKPTFNERALHPLLVKFLNESPDFSLSCKTIYHEKSKKAVSGKDKWNYPDIVGVYFAYDDYAKETLSLLHNTKQNHYKFFSFELKISLDFSNLKESYFQAVSNSSWANEGYLVVFEELDDELLSELRRLNQSFGIGVIKLESDIFSSKIVLSSKQRELDIQTLDMLLGKNSDFKDFIEDINKQIKAGVDTKIHARFDEVLSDEALQKYLKEKHIGG